MFLFLSKHHLEGMAFQFAITRTYSYDMLAVCQALLHVLCIYKDVDPYRHLLKWHEIITVIITILQMRKNEAGNRQFIQDYPICQP